MSSPREPTIDSLDPLPGRVIAGNFRVEKLIGSGAMGNVYKAEQLSLGKAVAVKVLHAHLMSDETLVMRFQREAKSASLLNHPNSIQIIDSGQDQHGTLYIAMELLSGRDLAEVIRAEFPLPLPRIVRIMSQVLAALDEAHAQGVVHRDLKPSNVMLIERRGQKDFVKVCDFGIAKLQGLDAKEDRSAMLTIQGLVCGTPEYMAPEQARAEPLDGRADLYSAAVILYQLVTGDVPFRADSPMGIVSRHLSDPPEPPSRRRPDLPIPQSLDRLILRGMEKSRELRFPTAVAFREEIEALIPTAGGPSTPIPPGQLSSMPTALLASGNQTAVVPSASAAQRFGTTADMTGRRSRKLPLISTTVGIAVAATIAWMGLRPPPALTTATSSPPKTMMAGAAAPQPAPPQQPVAPVAAPAPTAEPTGTTVPPPPSRPRAIATSSPSSARDRGPRPTKRLEARLEPAPAIAAPFEPAPAAPVATAVDKPESLGPRELLAEGERLLGQGEVQEACARGEEAKRLNPKLAPAFKFLGKCYMRAGNTSLAKENYKKYLELAPNASDAMFIRNIIK